MDQYNRRFHIGYPATSIKAWLRGVEYNNMPHFARGVLLTILLMLVMDKVVAPGVVAFLSSVWWEVRDYYKADGFDLMDVVCETLGIATIVVWTLVLR